MIRKRFFPVRWARILAWTAATLTWGSTAVAVASRPPIDEAPSLPVPSIESQESSGSAVVPTMPDSGLVVIRFTPTPPPPPRVITRTVTVPQVQQPAPAAVVSSGS